MKIKKLLATGLATAMAVTTLAGCGSTTDNNASQSAGTDSAAGSTQAAASNDDVTTITIYAYNNSTTEAAEKVAAAVSEITEPTIGVKVNLLTGVSSEQLNLALASGEDLDLFFAMPWQVYMVPQFIMMRRMGLNDKLLAMICLQAFSAFGVFMMKQFSENIPTSLLEACRIDGAGELTTFVNVAFPIIKPGFGALAIFTFINSWNEYPLQLVMLTQNESKTIALGIASKLSEMSNDFGLIMAGAALASVPIIIVFLCFQRYFTQGITMGAVKG